MLDTSFFIPYQETGYFSNLVQDYLKEEEKLKPFYSYNPIISSFDKIISEQTLKPTQRETLQTVIEKDYLTLKEEIHPKVLANIKKITFPNTFTITTGHQLNLFTGPLYTIYKIISTIRLSQEVQKAYPETHIIPLFWMATEDHDFAEINHLSVHGRNLEWDRKSEGATGRMSLEGIAPILANLISSLGIYPNLTKIQDLLQKAYLGYDTLAHATLSLYNQLFGKFGLVIIDADQRLLKKEFKKIVWEDIITQKSHAFVNQENKKLENLGYKAQVHPREINFFYLGENSRERILEIPNKEGSERLFSIYNSGITFSLSELKVEIETRPERFSPNVIMRPLYQETILPNLAYIGGGSEIAYWLSLKSTFDFFQIPFPILFLRNSALLIQKEQLKKAKKLGFTPRDLFKESKDLIREYVIRSSSRQLNLGNEILELKAIFERINQIAEIIDPTLRQSAEAIKIKTMNRLVLLEKKLIKKEKNNFDIEIAQIIQLKQKLFPKHSLQERTENYFPFANIYGLDLIDRLLEKLNPLEKEFSIITL